MRVAYLVNQYPKVSHSFIRREILALERRASRCMRIALRGWDDELADAEDRASASARATCCARARCALLAGGLCACSLTRPVRFLRALALALAHGRGAERPLPVHLAYLAEACRIAPWLRGGGIQHLHAHFGTNSAEVAMLVHALGGPRYSFTVHGPEEFDKAPLIGLAGEDRARCAFVVAISSFGRSQLYRLVEPRALAQGAGRALRPGRRLPRRRAERRRRRRRGWSASAGCASRRASCCCSRRRARSRRRHATSSWCWPATASCAAEIEARDRALRPAGARCASPAGSAATRCARRSWPRARWCCRASPKACRSCIMEAMALRRPVITTYVAGIPELVRPGENGWLVPAGDVEALADAMAACLDAPVDVLARMGEAARARAGAA